jgi:hypothetical protein
MDEAGYCLHTLGLDQTCMTTSEWWGKVRNHALATATDEALALIENKRAADGAAVKFKAR